MKLSFKCPRDGCSNTEKIKGKSGEKKIVKCSRCGIEGIVTFPLLDHKTQKSSVKPLTKTKKATLFCFIIISLLSIYFVIIPVSNGSLHFLTVLSGSMEPDIHVGDVVVSSKVNVYTIREGDIITFRYSEEDDPNRCITHRVEKLIEDEYGLKFKTKGDANTESDTRLVEPGEVIGKVIIVLPYLGHFGNFARSIWGYILFLLLPALLIIINESFRIYRIRKTESKKEFNLTH